ncbi:MAG: hypothetical protein EG825_00675, partial [Rhodocyclaceae bacterium]|nr:hypothetical protein [Rhodocyclaceae bacterium]
MLELIGFLGPCVGLWWAVATSLQASGRGWFLRNWIGSLLGILSGVATLVLFSFDAGFVKGLGLLLWMAATSRPWWDRLGITAALGGKKPSAPPSLP